MKDFDEYAIFKQSIEYINNTNNTMWTTWLNSLSDSERINLNNLVHTRRVNVSHDKLTANVPRKLVKIVKRNQDQ